MRKAAIVERAGDVDAAVLASPFKLKQSISTMDTAVAEIGFGEAAYQKEDAGSEEAASPW